MQEISLRSLRRKEDQSIYVIREAVASSRRPALLWSLGKDSTAMLHLVRKSFFGQVPMPVIHLDTGRKFPQMYAFRDQWAKTWELDLIVACNELAINEGVRCCMDRRMTCCHRLKTQTLQQVVADHGFDVLLVGIRRDEHGVRAKERYFSPRSASFSWNYRRQPVEVPGITPMWSRHDAVSRKAVATGISHHHPQEKGSSTTATAPEEPTASSQTSGPASGGEGGGALPGGHFRVHPLLHWAEIDIWSYTRLERIPVVELYFARDGQRYRSLGCEPATAPVASEAADIAAVIEELTTTLQSERGGRAQDKESAYRMERLRSLGYL